MKVFEYCILMHPTSEDAKTGKVTELIVPVTTVMAKDQNQATMLAGRAIPEDQLGNLERIEVAVRPF